METIKVSSKSNPNSVAGALANVFREKSSVEMQAIGAGALNQAIKAIAIARGFVAPSGKNLVCIPAFTDILIDSEERTAIKLIVEANANTSDALNDIKRAFINGTFGERTKSPQFWAPFLDNGR